MTPVQNLFRQSHEYASMTNATPQERVRKAMEITQGCWEDTQKDGVEAKGEMERLKKNQAKINTEIDSWKRRASRLSQDIVNDQRSNEYRDERNKAKMAVLDSLTEEKNRLLKRINDVESTISQHDEEIETLSCRGCGEDVQYFVKQLKVAREVRKKKETLSKVMNDEKTEVLDVIQKANEQVANCVAQLRQINDMMLDVSFGDYRETMEEGKEKYSKFNI